MNGAMPIHCAPSPPICVMPVISPLPSGLSRTIVWQPMPAPTSVPSGALIELLCGQPEQKKGVRAAIGSAVCRRATSSSARSRASTESIRTRCWQPGADGAGDQVGVEVARRREQLLAEHARARAPSRRAPP